nr:MAG TPA: hypothetical protein [Caudoviricetes sp.]
MFFKNFLRIGLSLLCLSVLDKRLFDFADG